jgi:hypothetical protein
VHGALNASAINVVDLEAQPRGGQVRDRQKRVQRRHRDAHHPGDPQSIDIISLMSTAPTCP